MSNVELFMSNLGKSIPVAKSVSKEKSKFIEKISLNFGGNEGRYQILPMDSVVTDFPFIVLNRTREVCVPRRTVAADGTETVYNAWIKLLPSDAYKMKNDSGRVVSSLTADEESIMKTAATLFDELYEAADGKNNVEISKNLCRYRNYTLFHAMCVNRWGFEDSRKPNRQNFAGLFVATARGFMTAVNDNIEEMRIMNGDDLNWLSEVYNNQLSGRTGCLLFSIGRSKTTPGFNVTASHKIGMAKNLEGVVISEEDAELMKDPVQSFLGWQANRDDETPYGQKRLFNASLYKEAIAFMSQQLAAVRAAKNSGASIADAITATNSQVLAENKGNVSTDPMLAAAENTGNAVNTQTIIEANTTPFQNPPVAQMDPVSNAPQAPASSPFNSPFGGAAFGGTQNNNNEDLPF